MPPLPNEQIEHTDVPRDELEGGPRYLTDEEVERRNAWWRKQPRYREFSQEAQKALGQAPQTEEDRWREDQEFIQKEMERLRIENVLRTRELEKQLWGQARGEETVAQRQFAEQLAQGQRLQSGALSSVRGLSGERAKRYSGAFGTQLRGAGGHELKSLRASEMQEAEQALVRFQGQRDALALRYLSMAYSADEAKRMADIEYQKMLTDWLQEEARRNIENQNRVAALQGGALGGIGRLIGSLAGAGKGGGGGSGSAGGGS